MLFLCAALCGCAGSNARESAVKTLESYVGLCASERTRDAKNLLMPNANQEIPCPNVSVASKISVDDNLIYTAEAGDYRLTDTGNGWRIDMRRLMTDNSPAGVLNRLRDVLMHEDVQGLMSLILPGSMDIEEPQAFWDAHVSSLNALYAAISATAVPWFQMEGRQAVCDVSGILLTFEVKDGRWYWVANW